MGWDDVRDQVLHLLWSLLPLLIFHFTPVPILDGALAGLAWALPREFVDQWPIERPKDTAIDLCFFALGGALAGLVVWVA